MFRQLKLTWRGMFHCTFSNNWPKLATLAENGTRTKEHKALFEFHGDLVIFHVKSHGNCEAPKISKLVYNSNNYSLWYL